MILQSPGRRVRRRAHAREHYGRTHKSRNGSGGGTLAGVYRRLRPSSTSTIPRSNTLSVPARVVGANPTTRHLSEGVTPPPISRDTAALLAAAATNPAVSDRQLRVFTVIVTVFDRGVDAATIAATLPNVVASEEEAGQILGRLVTAGLLHKRLRTVGYRHGQRVRRGIYTLVGGETA